jgi:hypothetical protein
MNQEPRPSKLSTMPIHHQEAAKSSAVQSNIQNSMEYPETKWKKKVQIPRCRTYLPRMSAQRPIFANLNKKSESLQQIRNLAHQNCPLRRSTIKKQQKLGYQKCPIEHPEVPLNIPKQNGKKKFKSRDVGPTSRA